MSILKLFEYTFSTLGFAEEAIEQVLIVNLRTRGSIRINKMVSFSSS